jgi:hypothetical protein
LRHAQFLQEPIRLLGTPADWVRSPAGSISILDWKADLRGLLGTVPELICSSVEMARFLDRRLAEQVRHKFQITVSR